MNKKFLSAVLFGALMVTSTGTFVSCKDYDDDITELWDAVNGQKTDLSTKITAVETSVSSLQSAQTGLQTEIAAAKAAAAAAQTAADKAAADAKVAALEAQEAAIEAAAKELATVKAALEATIAAGDAKSNEAAAKALEAAVKDLTAKVAAGDAATANAAASALKAAQGKLEAAIAAGDVAAQKAAEGAVADAKAELVADIGDAKADAAAALTAAVAQLEAADKTAAEALKGLEKNLEAEIAKVDGKVIALQAFQTNTEKTLEALAKADDALSASVTKLSADVKANAEAIGKNKAAIEAQVAALNAYKTSNDAAVAANKAAIEKTIETLNKHQEVLNKLNAFDVAKTEKAIETMTADIKKLSEDITKINNKLEVLSAAIYKGVTHVSLVASAASGQLQGNNMPKLELLSSEAVRTWTFGDKMPGAISFEKGKKSTFSDSFIIRVSPTDAVVTPENIKLINSKGADMEGLVKVTDVKAYDKLLTRGISANGLWEVVVEMDPEYDEETFEAATILKKNKTDKFGAPILYAVSVNSTLDEKENTYSRDVVSEYDITFATGDYQTSDELAFTVSGKDGSYDGEPTDVARISNRYDVKVDYTWANGVKAEPIFPDSKKVNVTEDESDDRSGKSYNAYPVTLNKPFTVTVEDKNIRGFYVTIDYDRAGDSDSSEKVAWKKYEPSIKGLNEVTETGSIDLTITDADANTDYICFRVYAVNYDGSLADPDGKAFEVVVGDAADELAYDCTLTWAAADKSEISYAEVAKDVFGDWVKNVADGPIYSALTSDTIQGKMTAQAAITGIKFYDKDKKELSYNGFSNIKYEDIKYVRPIIWNDYITDYDNNKKYSQVFYFYNDRGHVLKTLTITFTKVMPEFPASIKPFNGILQNGTLLKVYPKNSVGTKSVSYDLDNVWHGITAYTTFSQVLASGEKAIVEYVKTTRKEADSKVNDNTPALKVPTSILNPENEAFETEYPMIVTYNYGEISEYQNKDLKWNWTVEGTKFNVVFGNYVYDCTFAWTKEKPVLTYTGVRGSTSEIALSALTGKDWYGKAVYIHTDDKADIKPFNTYSNKIDVEVITGKDDVNEYYTAEIEGATYDEKGKMTKGAYIKLTATSTASQGEPVETVIRLKVTDIYGYTIVKDLPAFTMTFTSNK